MASPIAELLVSVGADTRKFTSGMDSVSTRIGSMVGDVAKLGAGLAVGIGAVAVPAIKLAGDLEQSVANISTVAPGIDTSKVFADLNAMSTRVPQSAQQLADSLYNIFSSIDIDQTGALQLTEVFGKGALAAKTDAQTFGTSILGVMNAFKLGVGDAGHIADVFFNTVNKGVVTGAELASSLGLVTGSAKAAGVDLDTMGGLIAGVTKEGGPAATSINNLSNFLAKLNSKEAIKGFTALGVKTIDAAGSFRDVTDILGDARTALNKLAPAARNAAVGKIFEDFQARAGFNTLISQLDFVKGTIAENKTATGSAATAYEKMVNTFNSQSTLLGNSVRAAFTTLGAELLPKLTPIVKGISEGLPRALDTFRAVWASFTIDPGALGIVLDNIRRWFGSDVANLVEPFTQKLMAAIPNIKAFATDAVATLGSALQTHGPAIAAGAATLFALANPVGALAVASAGLALAWAADWDNIRSKTALAVLGITDALRGNLTPVLQGLTITMGLLSAVSTIALARMGVGALLAGAQILRAGITAAIGWAAIAAPIAAVLAGIGLVALGAFTLREAFDRNMGGFRESVVNAVSAVLATFERFFTFLGNATPGDLGLDFLRLAQGAHSAIDEFRQFGPTQLQGIAEGMDTVKGFLGEAGKFKDAFGQGFPDIQKALGVGLTGIDQAALGGAGVTIAPVNRAGELGFSGGAMILNSPLVGQVIVQNEADEDRLVSKIADMLDRAVERAHPPTRDGLAGAYAVR